MRGKTRSNKFKKPSPLPIYLQLAEKIRAQMQQGKFAEDSRLPSVRELSALFDVNYLTARQAVKHLESEGLVDMQTGRGTFIVPPKNHRTEIAIIVPDLTYKVNSGISRGIHEASDERNILPRFLDSHNDEALELNYLKQLRSEKIEGALIYSTLNPSVRSTLLDLVLGGYPIVFIDRAPVDFPCWSISSNDREIGSLAARHLLEQGVKIPACLVADLPNLHERLRGFQDELNNLGVPLPQSRILNLGHDYKTIPEIIIAAMQLNPRPDGLFFFNDQHALTGLRQLHDMNINVPGEIKIIGCDDTEASQHSLPTLTSIRQNSIEIGTRAFALLCESMTLPLEERLNPRHIQIPVELVPRESTAR